MCQHDKPSNEERVIDMLSITLEIALYVVAAVVIATALGK